MKRRGDLARRHPDRRVSLPARDSETFEQLVERALDSLPEDFQRLLENVAIVIADLPTREQVDKSGSPDGDWLYGLYEGVPATEWGAAMVAFPNKITLFRLVLETDFADPDELAAEVRRTVIHELAHHAGISDQRLHELDYD